MRMLENYLENGLVDVWKARWRDVLMDSRLNVWKDSRLNVLMDSRLNVLMDSRLNVLKAFAKFRFERCARGAYLFEDTREGT